MAYGYSRRSYRPRRYSRSKRRGQAYLQLRGSQPPRIIYPKRRRSRRMRAVRSTEVGASTKATGTGHGDKFVLAQADPFDENVDGVKIPDANAQPSVPLKAEDTFDFQVNSPDTCQAQAFNPTLVSAQVYNSATGVGSTSWNWAINFGNASNSAKLTQMRTDHEMFRPVAHAIRITSGLAPTAAQGFVHVCVFTQALYNQSTWAYPTSIALMQNVPGYKRVPIGRLTAEGLTVVNRCLDVTSQRYVDTDSPVYANAGTMEFQSGLQWGSIIVAVTGVQTATVPITVEVINHVECIPRATAISNSTPAAKFNFGALAAATNGMSKTSPSALDSEKSTRKNKFLGNAFQALKTTTAGNARLQRANLFARNRAKAGQGIRNNVDAARTDDMDEGL